MQNIIKEAVSEKLEEIGVKIDSISLELEDGINTLFIKIDSESVVDTDLCAKVAEIVNPIIDKLDLDIEGEYVLDICSKGVSTDEQ